MKNKNNECKIILHPAAAEQMLKRRTVISVRPYSQKELTALYGVSSRTIYNWLSSIKKELGERRGRTFSVRQVETIFEELGVPYTYEITSSLSVA